MSMLRLLHWLLCRVWLLTALIVLAKLAVDNASTLAQPLTTQGKAEANAASGLPRTDATTTSEAAQKNQILSSDRWKRVENEFGQWLAVQVVMTPQQVDRMKAKLHGEIQNMSAAELQQFLNQWDAKLNVLLGKDAAEARQWLGQYLSVIADGYRPKFLKKLGISDLTNLTAAQIEDELNKLRADRMDFQQQRAFFDAGRQRSLQQAQQWQAASNQSLQDAGQGTAAEYGTYQTPYSPRQYNYQPLPPIVPFFW
jgi:hypothetical protein